MTHAPAPPLATDRSLLDRFLASGDEEAFAALVRAHGPMVLATARRVLGRREDAEDVCQAAFLVLARKAATLRNDASLGAWMYSTTYRLALRARAAAARRLASERREVPMTPHDPTADLTWREIRAVLDEEIQALPEPLRQAIVLCHLEGHTHAEAARQLGWSRGTLRRRLGQGRARLHAALRRRGLSLSAALATSLALGTATPAALAAALPGQIARTAAAFARTGAVGDLPRAVAALLEGEGRALVGALTRAATALVVILSVAAVALGGRDAVATPSAAASPPARAEADPERKAAPVEGRVLDPDGQPFAGARVFFVTWKRPTPTPPTPRAVTGADGRYRFDAPGEEGQLLATADGFGPAWPLKTEPGATTLRLAKDDVPIRGRVLDLQGRPVAGARVLVHALKAPTAGSLTPWSEAIRQRPAGMDVENEHLTMLSFWRMQHFFPPRTTDADGRFELTGVGRERFATLLLVGDTIETAEINAATRADLTPQSVAWYPEAMSPRKLRYVAATFDHAAAPGRVVAGTVRDAATGTPVAGATVQDDEPMSNPVYLNQTTTDTAGRYRLTGLARRYSPGYGHVSVLSPEDKPYLSAQKALPQGREAGPATLDFALAKGVWLRGQVRDGATGRGVPARIGYYVFAEGKEENAEARSLYLPSAFGLGFRQTDDDGRYRLVVPGLRGIVAARVTKENAEHYRIGVGGDTIAGGSREAGGLTFDTFPHTAVADDHDILAEVRPRRGDETLTRDLVLDPGSTATVEVRDADGRPLAGARVFGRFARMWWEHEGLKTATFAVHGLMKGEKRTLFFHHSENRLVGRVEVKEGDRAVATLEPASAVVGRLVGADGKPLADVTLTVFVDATAAGTARYRHAIPETRTDADGRFRVDGVLAGLALQATVQKPGWPYPRPVFDNLKLGRGETRDLGAVTVKKEADE